MFGPLTFFPWTTHQPTGEPSASNIPAFIANTNRRPNYAR